jgi:diguanylate cyclase (GGDEF)-like protein/PAS domain S-box-containing protein
VNQTTDQAIALEQRNQKWLLWIARLTILLVGMGLPVAALIILHYDLSDHVQELADTQAALVGRYASRNPDSWQFKPEHIEVSLKGIRPEDTRTVIEEGGKPIMTIGEPVPGWTLERKQAFSAFDQTYGQVRVIHGLGKLPLVALLCLSFSGAFSAAMYWLLRRFIIGPLNQAQRMRRLSEEYLAVNNKHLSGVLEAIPDAIVLKSAESHWLITNEPAKKLFRLHDTAWQGKTEMELAELHPEFRAAHEVCLEDDERAWAAGKLTLFVETFVDVDGKSREFEVRKMPVFDEHGLRQVLVIIGRDITARKVAEDELRIAATAFDSQEAMMITDPNGVILRVNRAFTDCTGYTSDEAIGQTPRLLKSGRHNADFYRSLWEAIKGPGGWQGEVWDRRKNGEEYPKWLTITTVRNDEGAVTHYIGAHHDITERKKAEERINELAFFDQLTGMPNRTLLLDRLKQNLTASARNGSYGALLYLDLDKFKTVNDTLGHDMGDLLLKQVAIRLTTCVRAEDTVARLGGDEFVVMMAGLNLNQEEAATRTEAVGEKILSALNQPYQLNDVAYHCTSSIGATLFSGQQTAIDVLMKQADLAMYKSKEAGRNALCFFDPDMERVVMKRATLENDLRDAIERKQFLLHYQAQMAGGRVTGAEALVRWQHPQRGVVSPAEFIPLAEETGLILPIGYWVLETACTQLAVWAARPEMAHLTVAVNVSAHQFRQPDFVAQVLAVLENTSANPRRLKLELTESLLVANVEEIIEKMFALKAKGVGFSLDDFGTGYSSLSYLKRLPLDQLKIDQSFVRDVLIDPNDAAIARTIIALAHSLGLGVIAEGVEKEAQRDLLASAGCHAYQGYFFSRPLPLEGFEAFAMEG